ncbi:MAG: glycoside hydrolase family 43 protein [Acidimicrobiales bacterium]
MHAPAVDARDFPDPFVLAWDQGWYAYATNAGGINVQVLTSEDLCSWQPRPDAFPSLPTWAQAGFTWAPAVLARPGGFVLYVTVREPKSGRQAIAVAVATDPGGPFLADGNAPLVFQEQLGGSIDPSPFVDLDGTAYLLWKADANAVGRRSSLWLAPLSGDGRSLTGPAIHLLDHDARWERPLIEAPSLVQAGDTYFLFYSANWWNTDRYAIGYAISDAVGGPYRKVSTRRPWFAGDQAVAGPGGQEWLVDADGQHHMAYHAWEPGRVGYPRGARRLHIEAVSFAAGRPDVM